MDAFTSLPVYLVSFLAVLTVIVFVHELGHYLVARMNGVRVETFSIGFGPEVFGWTARNGTRWKISAIPLGGYVKFFGDATGASNPGESLETMSPAERAVCFHFKPLGAKSAVVAAGPVANFLFAILIFAALFTAVGQPFTLPVVGELEPGDPAEAAGFRPGDRVVSIDGVSIERFEELRNYVALRAESNLLFQVERDGQLLTIAVTPKRVEKDDGFGGKIRIGQIGIRSGTLAFVRHDPLTALWYGTRETGAIVQNTLTYLGRMVSGHESGDQLSGPMGIAKISGDAAQIGLIAVISLMATLSVAIGLVNLFPVPMLDGGHLLFYAIEAIRGRPLGERAQDYGFRIGLALVLSLFLFATWNDLNRLQVFNVLSGLFS